MYRDIAPEILRVIEPVAQAHGLEIVDATLGQGPGAKRLRIILDTPPGDGKVTADDCARVHREVSHGLDGSGAIGRSVSLEVSSPGVDRVLGREIDFERSVGREVALETRELVGGRKRFKGCLVGFAGGIARVRGEDGTDDIPFAQVARAKALYPFDSPGAKGAKR